MHIHPNARLTPLGRERLLRRHIDHGEPLLALAGQAGISLRTAYKWLARYRSGGHTSLADRRSVRRTQRRTLDPQQLQHDVDLRHQRCTLRRVARAVPGDMIHVDTEQLGARRTLSVLDPDASTGSLSDGRQP